MWDFSDIQDTPIKESVFHLPQETLDRHADASPSEVRAYYYKNGGRIPRVQCAPVLADFGLRATYAAEDLPRDRRCFPMRIYSLLYSVSQYENMRNDRQRRHLCTIL